MTEFQTTISENTPIVLTIGNFDGVHQGHQRLLNEVRRAAQELQSTPAMVTFSPHTLMVVRPDIRVSYLTTLEEKLSLARDYGVHDTIIIQFNHEVAALSAEDFMNHLCSRFSIRGIVIGTDFSLGRNRKGNVAFLKEYGLQQNICVQAVELEEKAQERISSTRIRTLISKGQIAEANSLLGHSVLLTGEVIDGGQPDNKAGITTVALQVDPHKLLPAHGVYAVCVTIHNGDERDLSKSSPVYTGVADIGIHPTFNGREHLVEVHLLEEHLSLDEKFLRVEFITHLREERRFLEPEALKEQITVDVQQAHQILASRRVSH